MRACGDSNAAEVVDILCSSYGNDTALAVWDRSSSARRPEGARAEDAWPVVGTSAATGPSEALVAGESGDRDAVRADQVAELGLER